jgi:nucleotide-binding universal stress UspA family protein
MSYSTIAVGSDSSPSSLQAVERAAELARSEGAALIVVCAYHPMTAREQALITAALGDATMRVTGTAAAEEALAAAVQQARSTGHEEVEGALVIGDAVEALLAITKQRSVGLIVVGNRGINTLSGRLLGSVASDVSQRAPCDVLIVHTSGGRKD